MDKIPVCKFLFCIFKTYGNYCVLTRLHNLLFQKQHKNIFLVKNLLTEIHFERLEFCYTCITACRPEKNISQLKKKEEEEFLFKMTSLKIICFQ